MFASVTRSPTWVILASFLFVPSYRIFAKASHSAEITLISAHVFRHSTCPFFSMWKSIIALKFAEKLSPGIRATYRTCSLVSVTDTGRAGHSPSSRLRPAPGALRRFGIIWRFPVLRNQRKTAASERPALHSNTFAPSASRILSTPLRRTFGPSSAPNSLRCRFR